MLHEGAYQDDVVLQKKKERENHVCFCKLDEGRYRSGEARDRFDGRNSRQRRQAAERRDIKRPKMNRNSARRRRWAAFAFVRVSSTTGVCFKAKNNHTWQRTVTYQAAPAKAAKSGRV